MNLAVYKLSDFPELHPISKGTTPVTKEHRRMHAQCAGNILSKKSEKSVRASLTVKGLVMDSWRALRSCSMYSMTIKMSSSLFPTTTCAAKAQGSP